MKKKTISPPPPRWKKWENKLFYADTSAYILWLRQSSSQQQPRQGVQVSHVRVVVEDAVDPLLLVGEDVVQLPLQLRRLPRRPLGRG